LIPLNSQQEISYTDEERNVDDVNSLKSNSDFEPLIKRLRTQEPEDIRISETKSNVELQLNLKESPSAHDVSRAQSSDMTQCGLCCKLVTDPITLPCLDSFCAHCLKTLSFDGIPSCPSCQTTFYIPSTGLQDMPYNKFTKKVVEIARISNKNIDDQFCDVCKLNAVQDSSFVMSLAKKYCRDCHQKYCENCLRYHQLIKATNQHSVVALGQGVGRHLLDTMREEDLHCGTHKEEQVLMQCDDCDELVCRLCCEETHSLHSFHYYTESSRLQARCELEERQNSLQQTLQENQAIIQRVILELDSRRKNVEVTKQAVKAHAENLREKINEFESDMLRKVDGECNNGQLEEYWRQSDKLQVKQRKLLSFLQAVQEHGSDRDVIKFKASLCQRSDDIISSVPPSDCRVDEFRFSFTPSDLVTASDKLIGTLETQFVRSTLTISPAHRDATYCGGSDNKESPKQMSLFGSPSRQGSQTDEKKNSSPSRQDVMFNNTCVVKPSECTAAQETSPVTIHTGNDTLTLELIKKFDVNCNWHKLRFCNITGATELNHRIYVICEPSKCIQVYDAITYERLQDIQLKMRDQEYWFLDIASCIKQSCLYINDCLKKCVWRVTVEDTTQTWDEWINTAGQWYVKTLSITSDGKLLMIGGKPARLDVYGLDSSLERTIPLSGEIDEPRHAMQVESGNYIISYGWYASPRRGVCEVTETGHVIHSYVFHREVSDLPVRPIHIAVDNLNRVYVVDWVNEQVLFLDSKLSSSTVLLSKRQLNGGFPRRIMYRDDKLIITNDKEVHVYSVHITAAHCTRSKSITT